MSSLNELKSIWQSQQADAFLQQVGQIELNKMIIAGVRKERRLVMKYVIKTGVWVLLVTGSFSWLLIRFYTNDLLVYSCLAGLGLYIPFTYYFIKRFKVFYNSGSTAVDLYSSIKLQYASLKQFYRLKKWLDVLIIPLSCWIIVLALIVFGVMPAVKQYIWPALLVFAFYSTAFIVVTRYDNRKYFTTPLKKLTALINEAEHPLS